jgi:hypothetical protein
MRGRPGQENLLVGPRKSLRRSKPLHQQIVKEIDELDDRVTYRRRSDNRLHRVDGPAVEYAGGGREWWVEGKLHRVDGPAIEYAGGEREWFLTGLGMSEAAWLEAVGPAKKS